MPLLYAWQNFYVLVGSAAGALTGLQFLVIAFIADMPMKESEVETSDAFSTPTIVHFSSALLLAATMLMPWPNLHLPAIFWTLGGLAGIAYSIRVIAGMRRQTGYAPVLEDWLFHAAFPLVVYGALAAAALVILLTAPPHGINFPAWCGLFAIATAVLLQLVIGIHNAWDTVTYLVVVRRIRLQATRNNPTGHPQDESTGTQPSRRIGI